MRAAVKEALFVAAQDPPGRVEVVAFRTAEEFEPFAPEGAQAYYLKYEGGPARIVLSAEWTPRQRAVVAHELTHHLASSILLRQPRWLSEGLAATMESLGEQRLERTLVVGVPPRGRLATARDRPVEVRDLLKWEEGGPTLPGPEYYAAAWLLVHYLMHQRAEAFADLLARLSRGEALADAWNAALPEYDLDRSLPSLDLALGQWLRANTLDPAVAELDQGQRYWPRKQPVVLRTLRVSPDLDFAEQAIPPVEVHALRISLSGYGPRATRALGAEVAEALREDPAHPIALAARARLDGVDALPLARRSVGVHPDDPRAWTFLAESLKGPEVAAEREAAYRRAAELAPDNAAALHNLGAELLERSRSGEALPLLRRAARLAPWSAVVLDRYAAALADVGRCADAARVERQALDVLWEPAAAGARGEMQTRLESYRRRCGATEAGGPRSAH
jgi:tetratricopeptide (TPR) repeat protein